MKNRTVLSKDLTEILGYLETRGAEVFAAIDKLRSKEDDSENRQQLVLVRRLFEGQTLQSLAQELNTTRENVRKDQAMGGLKVKRILESKKQTTEPTNINHANNAFTAIRAFAEKTGLNWMNRDDFDLAIVDLIGDLMHLCDKVKCGSSFNVYLERAKEHYNEEVFEERINEQ